MKNNKETIVTKIKEIHGDKYDLSKVDYKDMKTKICVICPIHGEFWISPSKMINRRQGCKKCGDLQKGRSKRKTTKDFILESKEIHGNKYDYSKVEYVNNKTKVCIICPEHGEFWISPNRHLSKKQGCPICGIKKSHESTKMTTDNFIQKAKLIHGDKYDYSKVNLKSRYEKVCIICPIHGEFWQTPITHLKGSACPKCGLLSSGKKQKKETSEFIRQSKLIHGDKYDYSKVDYINAYTKVCIICPEHGEFWQTPIGHLHNKQGCPKCSKKEPYNQKTWIEKAKQIHGDKYDYSKVTYKNQHSKVTIICNKCGHEFTQRASSHISGFGCPKCASNERREKFKSNTEDFIKKAKQIHGDKYDYSKVDYINAYTKVCIICLEHGEFWQEPGAHLRGNGCPICKKSKLENEIENFLKLNNIKYEKQKTFKWLKNNKTNNNLYLDFYLPEYNKAIECQGGQHFTSVKKFGGDKMFQIIIERDKIKYNLCQTQNINILYFIPKRYSEYSKQNSIYKNNAYFNINDLRQNL